jgi:hypothetical protein
LVSLSVQLSACLRRYDSARSAASRLSPARRYVTVLLGLTLLGATAVAGVNAIIDPLSFFALAHPLNRIQPAFDERAQKTNWLQARPGQFNAVLLGSSRSTYIDQRDFAPWRMFNYAANAMWPAEYKPYLDHFTDVNGRPPDLVVLGVDFFGSRRGVAGQSRPPRSYTQTAGDIRHRVSSLLSLGLLTRSLDMAALSAGLIGSIGRMDYYDRDNIRHFKEFIDPKYRAQDILSNLEVFQKAIYGRYTYNTDLVRLWTQLRAAYPHSRFIVFTTPIAEPMFALLVREGLLDEYDRWLADLTTAFGEVWDFMGLNSVTTDISRYRDAQHFDPGIGRLIVNRLLQRLVDPQHADFGRRVTPESLRAHMAYIGAQSACLDRDPVGTARAWVEKAETAADASAHSVVYRNFREAAGTCPIAVNDG